MVIGSKVALLAAAFAMVIDKAGSVAGIRVGNKLVPTKVTSKAAPTLAARKLFLSALLQRLVPRAANSAHATTSTAITASGASPPKL